MSFGIHNFSEIGKLNKVLLHRLGEEVEGLTPDNFERLLFDDIPYLELAQKEHDEFASILRDNHIEVVYYVEETAKALADEKIKAEFLNKMLDETPSINSDTVRDALYEYLYAMDNEKMVAKIIAGVKKEELGKLPQNSLQDFVESDYPFFMDPMPNLYFTRDPGACVGNGLNVHKMHTPARQREALFLEYMYKYNKDFAPEGTELWYDYEDPASIEGGDVLVLNKETVAVGLSQRTSANAIERFAERVLKKDSFKRVLVFEIPKKRAFMHLDTVFTMVDFDKFTIHPEIEGPLRIFEITLDKQGKAQFKTITDTLPSILAKVLHVPAVDLIRCGGNDLIAAQREQWNDGSNTLAIAPGTVVTYERNYVSNDLLDKKGIKVLTMTSSELSRGRGGPRCMSCPVNRDDL